jgi:2-polyprenyl-3-methyl-5-hydroxy-6-metoxy-1,4-benzoquinol methylase
MSAESKVQSHFEADARRFDAIYETHKGPITRFVDNFWRGVVQKRLELNVEILGPLTGKSVLDVGCGSGRFCLAFADRGAARVLGVDFAASMIDLAREAAARAGLEDRCEFRVGAFPDVVNDGPFDVCTANGFFDYVAEPVTMIRSMRELTRETMIMSFPKAYEWRVPVRRVRFWLNGCPLFLYSEHRVRGILEKAGVEDYNWIELDRDFLVVAHL